MAKSKYEYVRQFEGDETWLQNCWLLVRLDGRAFHRFTEAHHYVKPNDERGLRLMVRAAQVVMGEFPACVLAYGHSDEFSFVFHKEATTFDRRISQLLSTVVSTFASAFAMSWPRFFPSTPLTAAPAFHARVATLPSRRNLRDYLSWRQADCHMNNLYNTCFWRLVQDRGLSPAQAQDRLKGTLSSDKNELLAEQFGLNYNTLPDLYRRGTAIIRHQPPQIAKDTKGLDRIQAQLINSSSTSRTDKGSLIVLNEDIMGNEFWEKYPGILQSSS